MIVDDIVDLIIALSPSSELQSSDLERSIYLSYINLVWSEVYSKIATDNRRAQIRENFVNTEWTEIIETSRKPLAINQVYLPLFKNNYKNGILPQKSIFEIQEIDPDLSIIDYPKCFFLQNDIIRLYPQPPEAFIFSATVSYTPDFEPLSLNSTLPIPNAYYRVIADGSIKYLLIDMGGFKDNLSKEKAEKRFIEGMNDLITFIANESSKYINISTYSNM